MRESRTYGSVRGAASNGRSYRESTSTFGWHGPESSKGVVSVFLVSHHQSWVMTVAEGRIVLSSGSGGELVG